MVQGKQPEEISMTLDEYTIEQLEDEIRQRKASRRLSSRAIRAGNEAVAQASGLFFVLPESILSRNRSKRATAARYHSMNTMWQSGFSYEECSRFFDRDRTLIMHAIKTVNTPTPCPTPSPR